MKACNAVVAENEVQLVTQKHPLASQHLSVAATSAVKGKRVISPAALDSKILVYYHNKRKKNKAVLTQFTVVTL